MTSDNSRHRLGLLAVTALSLFGALFARLWFLQVVEGDSFTLVAEGNATREVVIPAPRGRILDRNGIVLVENRESVVLGIEAEAFAALTEGKQDAVLGRLVTELNRLRTPVDQLTSERVEALLGDPRFSPFRPIPVAEDLTVEQEVYFAEQVDLFPSIVVERATVRSYPHGSLAAHVLGYVGPLSDEQWQRLENDNDADKPYAQTDEIGKAGVEASYERFLRGTPGQRVYEVDRLGAVVREIESERREPGLGDDLYLAIDARVQAETEAALRSGLAKRRETQGELGRYPAEAGAAAIVDPRNGQVMAMASYPTYDPEQLVGGISCPTWRDLQGLPREGKCGSAMTREIELLTKDGSPPIAKLLNRAIQGTYPAASTFKLGSSLAGVNLGLIDPAEFVVDPGYYDIPGCTGAEDFCRVSSPSAENGGVGSVDLARALTVSSDSFYYRVGNNSWALYKQEKVGPEAFQDEVRKLGFGEPTGVDLTSEAAGRIPGPEWLAELDVAINGGKTDAGKWGSGNSINMAIGQGDVLVTPLQNANAYAAFANGGTLYEPSLLDRVTRSNEPDALVVRHEPVTIRTVDWGQAYGDMVRGFDGVTRSDDGFATALRAFEGFPHDTWSAAGKTGTAETGTDAKPKEDHSWFVGWGPSAASRYSAAVIMEHSGSGGSAAAPAVRQIFEAIARNQLDLVDLDAVADPFANGTTIDAEAALGAN